MIEISQCRFCEREIPSESKFCPYCGGETPIYKPLIYEAASIISKIKSSYAESAPKIKDKVAEIISKVEKNIESAKWIPQFVNKQKIQNILQNLQKKVEVEEDRDQAKDLEDWVQQIEKTISGDKCIICLQEFNIDDEKQVEVDLCPNCNYAGHPNHFHLWLEQKSSCPICRAELKDENLLKGNLTRINNEIVFMGYINQT